jgi:predicted secreted protein
MAERLPAAGSYGVFIKTGADFLVLVCQTDLTFDRSRDTINAPSKCGPKQIPSNNPTYEISGTAQVLLSDDDEEVFSDKASEAFADTLFVNKTIFDWKIGPLSGIVAPGDVVYEGSGFFSNLSTSYPNEDVATFDFTIGVDGEYTKTIEPATT